MGEAGARAAGAQIRGSDGGRAHRVRRRVEVRDGRLVRAVDDALDEVGEGGRQRARRSQRSGAAAELVAVALVRENWHQREVVGGRERRRRRPRDARVDLQMRHLRLVRADDEVHRNVPSPELRHREPAPIALHNSAKRAGTMPRRAPRLRRCVLHRKATEVEVTPSAGAAPLRCGGAARRSSTTPLRTRRHHSVACACSLPQF